MNCTTCKRELPDPPGKICVHCGTPLAKGARANRDPLIGAEVAGRFRVEELIGQGGMGKVYRARHLSLDKLVCLKMLKPSLLDDPTLVGRFEREAKAASRINHPNCIQVLDFGRNGEEGTLFIAMEYIQGKDLRLVLRDEWPLDEARMCQIMAQVCGALVEAHSQNVLHRDLKPENIMVEQRRDQSDFVKVLDFGIAKIMDSDVPGLTRADVVCGTPQYMAPEQATGSALDARCDLYSLGVILYQLSTGHLPFDGQNSMEVLTKHVNEVPVAPRTKMPQAPISEAMEKLTMRALEKEPSARPQTALEFQKALLDIVQLHKSGVAMAPSGPTPTQEKSAAKEAAPKDKLPPKTPTKAPTRAPTGAADKAAATPAVQPSGAALEPSAPPAPSKRNVVLAGGLAAVAVIALLVLVMSRGSPPEVAPVVLADVAVKPLGAPIGSANKPAATPSADPAPAQKARDPKKAEELVAQARQMQLDGNTAAARDLLESAIESDDTSAEAHFRLGGLFMMTKPQRAREEYEKARKLDPKKYDEQVQVILSTLQ